MSLFDKIKKIFQKMFQKQPQLTEGEKFEEKKDEQPKQTKQRKTDLKDRVKYSGITIFEKYKMLQNQIKDSSELEDDYLGKFYDSLVGIYGEISEHNYDELKKIHENIQMLNENMLTISKDVRERGEVFSSSNEYREIVNEYNGFIGEKANIQETWDNCVKRFKKEYRKEDGKYEDAKMLLDKSVDSNNTTRLSLAKALAIEYAVLTKIPQKGELTEEQYNNIESSLGIKLKSNDIAEFIETRMEDIKAKSKKISALADNNSIFKNGDDREYKGVEKYKGVEELIGYYNSGDGIEKYIASHNPDGDKDIKLLTNESIKTEFIKYVNDYKKSLHEKVSLNDLLQLYTIKKTVWERGVEKNKAIHEEGRGGLE